MTPMPAESLTKESTDQEIQDKIAMSIEACMKEGGKEMKQCAAMSYDMARRATGKALDVGR